jgi:hypothetical protein
MQPPMAHCGRPQLPAGVGLQIGKSRDEAVCAAGTLSSFSSFVLSHSGQWGVSLDRTSNSNSAEHWRQLYSYKGTSFLRSIQEPYFILAWNARK